MGKGVQQWFWTPNPSLFFTVPGSYQNLLNRVVGWGLFLNACNKEYQTSAVLSRLRASGTWLRHLLRHLVTLNKSLFCQRGLGQSTSIVISDALRANCLLGKWYYLDLMSYNNWSSWFFVSLRLFPISELSAFSHQTY